MPLKKYPLELRERPVRMVLDAPEADPSARRSIFRRIGDQLGVNSETLRSWVNQDQVDAGDRPGTTTADAQGVKDLEKENRELRRANQILKSACLDSNRECNTSINWRRTWPGSDVRVCPNTNAAESGICGRTVAPSAISHAVSECRQDQSFPSSGLAAASTTQPQCLSGGVETD